MSSATTVDVDLARTVTAVIAGAGELNEDQALSLIVELVLTFSLIVVVVVVCFALAIVIYMFRERALYARINEQNTKIETMHKVIETRLHLGQSQFESLEDLLKPYKKHLLQSAYDLQSRLNGQLGSCTIFNFKHTRSISDQEYMINSTIYFFAEFLGWMEVIRSKIVFITGSAYAESLNALFDVIRFQFTGETLIQGNGEEVNSDILQLFIVDIRSIGNVMLMTEDNFRRPITVDVFLRRLEKARKIQERKIQEGETAMVNQATDGNDKEIQPHPLDSEERVDVVAFKKIIEPLMGDIERLATLCDKGLYDNLKAKRDKMDKENPGWKLRPLDEQWSEKLSPPKRRIAIIQVLHTSSSLTS
jgi:hypothetical protein